jgi:hypothetical protein
MKFYDMLCEAKMLGIGYIELAIAENMLEAGREYKDETEVNIFPTEAIFEEACSIAVNAYYKSESHIDYLHLCKAVVKLMTKQDLEDISKWDIILEAEKLSW